MWPHLPLEDLVIAKALECEKQQVINLRAVAVQKAAKRLKDAQAWPKKSAAPGNLPGVRTPFRGDSTS